MLRLLQSRSYLEAIKQFSSGSGVADAASSHFTIDLHFFKHFACTVLNTTGSGHVKCSGCPNTHANSEVWGLSAWAVARKKNEENALQLESETEKPAG